MSEDFAYSPEHDAFEAGHLTEQQAWDLYVGRKCMEARGDALREAAEARAPRDTGPVSRRGLAFTEPKGGDPE